MLNWIRSGLAAVPALAASASTMACRSVPVPAPGAGLTPPLSLVLVTTKVDRSDRSSRLSRNRLAVGRRRRRAGRRRGRGPDWRVRSEEAKNMMQHLPFEDGVRYH